jgi:hypothetical protein
MNGEQLFLDPHFDSLNSISYLFLREISEPRDNSLRIVVQEAVANRLGAFPSDPQHPELAAILKDSWPIESIEGCRSFELSWKHYVAYLITEEMAGSCGEYKDESYSGNRLRLYTRSHFLDHLARDTGAHTEPVQHFKLTCENHLIDIAAYEVPTIRLLEGNSEKLPRIQ